MTHLFLTMNQSAGLASGAWITVDDTGARHKARNGFCTQIGNAHFTGDAFDYAVVNAHRF